MTPVTKKDVEEIIGGLDGQCSCYGTCSPAYKHPVRLGDVLEKVLSGPRIPITNHKSPVVMRILSLILKWEQCGISNSLQQIVEESGWEKVVEVEEYIHKYSEYTSYQLKSKEANALFSLLKSTLLPEKP